MRSAVSRSALRIGLLLLLLAAIAMVLVIPRGLGPPAPATRYAMGRGPTVVLVHGLGSRIGHWLPTARHLARDHRVVLVDLPGHGATAMPTPFSLEAAVRSLSGALAEEPGPVVLVGHSLGGLVAAQAALDHPDRVRALVLVETALKPQIVGEERDALLRALEGDYQNVLRAAYESFGRDTAQGRMLYEEVAALEPSHVKPWIRLALRVDLSERMRHLKPPLLAVLADRSWATDESWAHAARALGYDRIPRVDPVRLEKCGHFVMLDRPQRLAALIAGFAARPDTMPIAAR
jgi:pimeloyl-ACP methyl ester carboxylesterase